MRLMTHYACLATALVLVVSCGKEKQDLPTALGGGSTECGTSGARLQATFDGASWCANASLFAAFADILTVNGITTMGSTLTMELDSLGVGTYAMSAESNRLLFTTNLGLAYNSSDAEPATLNITSHDAATRRIQGNFSGNLSPVLGGGDKAIAGSFDLFYVE